MNILWMFTVESRILKMDKTGFTVMNILSTLLTYLISGQDVLGKRLACNYEHFFKKV